MLYNFPSISPLLQLFDHDLNITLNIRVHLLCKLWKSALLCEDFPEFRIGEISAGTRASYSGVFNPVCAAPFVANNWSVNWFRNWDRQKQSRQRQPPPLDRKTFFNIMENRSSNEFLFVGGLGLSPLIVPARKYNIEFSKLHIYRWIRRKSL